MTFKVKRGGTFRLEGQLKFDDEAEDITDIDIESAIRNKGGVTACATVEKTTLAEGKFTLDFGDTAAWPLGLHEMDIKYTVEGDVLYTETVNVIVVKEVTKGGDCVED